jgi:hypothetical protein
MEAALDILRRAQLAIANKANWTHGASERIGKRYRQVCARQAITDAGAGREVETAMAYRCMAEETPGIIRIYSGAPLLAEDDRWHVRLIQHANDCGGETGHARVMGMFCRAIAKLEEALA